MRILHIASGDFFSTYGGGQVYVKNVVDEMIRQGEDVAVVSMTGTHNGVVKKDYRGIPLFEISGIGGLEDAVLEAAPDIIHAHSLKDTACRIGRDKGIPVVVTAHHGGILCPAGTRLNCNDEICHAPVNHKNCLPCVLRGIRSGKYWYPFMRLLPCKAYSGIGNALKGMPFIPFVTPIGSAANNIKGKIKQWQTIASECLLMIAPCDAIANAMTENGLSAEKVRVVPHGIPLPAERPEFPTVSDCKVKFFYVGRICYAKGIHILLEAFTSVSSRNIELHLIGGAGNKQERRYLEKLKTRFAADTRILWHGKIPPESVFEATRSFHVAVSPAIYLEVYGLNIAEALALGKPVLATESGGGEMQISEGVNGWLVPPGNPLALAEKIKSIALSPGMLPAMSENCHAIAVSDHCKRLAGIYIEAIDNNI